MITLTLTRTYLPGGTNGTLSHSGNPICHTIELPWRDNRRNISCIPEGRYRIARTWTRRFGYGLKLLHVPDRSGILIHAANDAAGELEGCIAPATKLTGEGKGIYSRIALERVERIVSPALEQQAEVWLEVLKMTTPRLGASTLGRVRDHL